MKRSRSTRLSNVDISLPVSVNKFAYFNHNLEESDDDWTMDQGKKCKVCKKTFSSKWHLKKHSIIHTASAKKETYKCVICSKRFFRKHLLEQHRCNKMESVSRLEDSINESLNLTNTSMLSTDVDILDESNLEDQKTSTFLHSTLME